MPFKSRAQRRWMYANNPEMAERWESETGKEKLPEHVGKKTGRKRSSGKVGKVKRNR